VKGEKLKLKCNLTENLSRPLFITHKELCMYVSRAGCGGIACNHNTLEAETEGS
jgi:hypothetical protein